MGSNDKEVSDKLVDTLCVQVSDGTRTEGPLTVDESSPQDPGGNSQQDSCGKGSTGDDKGKAQHSTQGASPLLDRSSNLPTYTGWEGPLWGSTESSMPPAGSSQSHQASDQLLTNDGRQCCLERTQGRNGDSKVALDDGDVMSLDLGALTPVRSTDAARDDGTNLSSPGSTSSGHSGYHKQTQSSGSRFSEDSRSEDLGPNDVQPAAIGRSLSDLATEVYKGSEGEGLSPLEDEAWKRRGKHFFIFSSAGKPIYSRYGDEGRLAGFMAIMQAMLAVVQARGDCAKTLQAGRCRIAFLLKGPMVLVGLSRVGEASVWLTRQLELMYFQILSLATGALLRVLERNPGSDVRNLVKGSHGLLETLIGGFSSNPSYLLEAFCPVRMRADLRSTAADALNTAVKHCGAKCGMLLVSNQLVALSQDKSAPLHVQDLILLINFVVSNSQYRERGGAEFSTPICMPHLHMTAFLHAYIYCIDPASGIVVIFLMTHQDTFHLGSVARVGMEEVLHEAGVLQVLKGVSGGHSMGQIQIEDLPLVAGGGKARASPLQYFIFLSKSKTCPQFVSSKAGPLQQDMDSFKHMMRSLSCAYSAMFEGHMSMSLPLHQTHWQLDDHYAIFAQVDQDWDCYLVCDALTDKGLAVKICRQLSNHLLMEPLRSELFIHD